MRHVSRTAAVIDDVIGIPIPIYPELVVSTVRRNEVVARVEIQMRLIFDVVGGVVYDIYEDVEEVYVMLELSVCLPWLRV